MAALPSYANQVEQIFSEKLIEKYMECMLANRKVELKSDSSAGAEPAWTSSDDLAYALSSAEGAPKQSSSRKLWQRLLI